MPNYTNILFIINYNSDSEVLRLLSSSDLSVLSIGRIVIYSNGSSAFDTTLLDPQCYAYSEILCIFAENNGYAAAINRCIEWSSQNASSASFLFFSNADISVHRSRIPPRHPFNQYDICGFPMYEGNSLVFDRITPFDPLIPARFKSNSTKQPKYGRACIVHGGFFGLRHEWICRSKLRFEEDYFLYWEEFDFFFRASTIGCYIGVSDSALITHDGNKACDRSLARFYLFRNGIYFYSSVYRPRYIGFLLAFAWISLNTAYALLCLVRGKDVDWYMSGFSSMCKAKSLLRRTF
jgi:GT2 family glycosyltransferase